ncbi:mRNA interferase [Desulforhabdus sp. TSK]|nr:mRNA interferase [Desulforhabdus sp. TSK]
MVAGGDIRRGDVFLISLDPTRGDEIQKTRPCVIVSPDELNANLRTFIVAPLTTGGHPYPFRVVCKFQGRSGHIVLDQIRTVDRERLVRRLGRLAPSTLAHALAILQEMFTP